MKLIICAALLIPLVSHAQQAPTRQQQAHCTKVAEAFEMAASARDSHAPAMAALNMIAVPQLEISVAQGKRIINTVYANPAFEDARGEILGQQIYRLCLFPNGTPKPFAD